MARWRTDHREMMKTEDEDTCIVFQATDEHLAQLRKKIVEKRERTMQGSDLREKTYR